MRRHLRVFPDPDTLAVAGAELFCELGGEAIGQRGRFAVALAGGSTPRAMFQLLAVEPHRSAIDWSTLQVFWSDERAVPPDDAQSNYRMAREALLERVPVPPGQIHRMPADTASLTAAAAEYAAEIQDVLGNGPADAPWFDLIMLGMGDDGHTASLFPETEALDAHDRIVAPNYVPKLDAHRMTFTPKLINAAANVLFLIAGTGKAGALQAVLEGPRQPRRYPSQLVAPRDGALYWYIDRAAASKLQHRSE